PWMSASKIKVSFGQGEKPRLNFIGSNFRWCIPVRDQSDCDSRLKRPGEYSSSLGSAFPRNSKGPLFGDKEYSHSCKRKRKRHPPCFRSRPGTAPDRPGWTPPCRARY